MDIGRTITFIFDDEEWLKKVLIGGCLMIIPILGQLMALGYGMEIARRVVKGHPQPLPEWEDWGQIAMDGLMNMIVTFVWSLPLILISSCLAIPFVFLPTGDEGGVLFIVLISCFSLVILVGAILVAVLSPAAIVHYAVTGELGKAFQFREIFDMVRQNLGAYLMVMLVVIVIVPIISSLGSILLGCGALFTTFAGFLVMYHAYGQAYRTAVGNVESEAEYAY